MYLNDCDYFEPITSMHSLVHSSIEALNMLSRTLPCEDEYLFGGVEEDDTPFDPCATPYRP